MDERQLMAKLALAGKNVPWLAEIVGISPQAMYKKLSGQSSTTINDAKIIAEALDLSNDDIRLIFFN